MSAALIRAQVMGVVGLAVAVGVGETGLLAISARQPAEEVVEGPVFHHHQDDVIDPGRGRGRQGGRAAGGRSGDPLPAGQRNDTGGRGRTGEKRTLAHRGRGLGRLGGLGHGGQTPLL